MIKEQEIEYYRKNILNRYITPVMREIAIEEQRQERLRRTELLFKKLKDDLNYKQCKRCKKIKPITEFYKNPLKSKGVFDYCKECAKKRAKELRDERQRTNPADNTLRKST